MRRIISWLSYQKAIFFLILAVVIYQTRSGNSQWLLGWDSIVPELNWKLNFTRAIAGAWQEYQGLGLTGGMAHLADLSRMIILWMVDLVVPTQYVRWVWHMGMLVLGPIGVWYLGKKLWRWSENACFSASIFYLLNLATVQYFFVPYEAFSSFYGFLPWLIAIFLAYIDSGKVKDLSRIVLVGILATSAFYVQTLFVVYAMVIGVLSLGYLRNWKRVLIAFLTIFLTNSFWLMPVIYGVVNGGRLVGLAKINSIASPETALMNGSFGDWQNVVMLRGYWLQYIEWIRGNEWGRLMSMWLEWSNQWWVEYVAWGLFGVSFMGALCGVVKKKISWGWIAGLSVTYMMVASFGPPFSDIYIALVNYIPLFGEMFRSAFTKWSVVLALFIGVGVGSFVANVKNKWVSGIFASLILLGCLSVTWPIFKEGIIFEKMKVDLPTEYLKMLEHMKSRTNYGRVAYLPVHNMWSWKHSDWGYEGSGFMWYGIEQPILDRAFDVWSPYNETFYNELSTALYGENADQLKMVLDKYDVRYVLLDESVIAPGQGKDILRIDETKKMAQELGWGEKFHDSFLTVWDTGIMTGEKFVSAPESYAWVEADTSKVREDVISSQVGTYVSSTHENSPFAGWRSLLGLQPRIPVEESSVIAYPFAGLMREEIKNVEYGESGTTIITNLKFSNSQIGTDLRIPGWEVGDIVRIEYKDGEPVPAYYVNGQPGPVFWGKEKPDEGKNIIYARISEGPEWREYLKNQEFEMRNQEIVVEVPGEPQVYDFGKEGQGTIGNCDVLKRGSATKSQISNSQILKSESQSSEHSLSQGSELSGTEYIADERGAVCDYILMTELDTRLSYLMRLQGENSEGRSLKYFLYNTGSKRNDIEFLLSKGKFDQTFSLLPWEWDGTYTLNIETRSFGQRAENTVKPVEVRWFPLEQIARAQIVENKEQEYRISNSLKVIEVKKTGTWLYIVETKNGGLLKLSQGYDDGWVSPYLEHVKVDGWANGWMVPSGEHQIVIFYWPQLLQYFGFVMLGSTILWLVLSRKTE